MNNYESLTVTKYAFASYVEILCILNYVRESVPGSIFRLQIKVTEVVTQNKKILKMAPSSGQTHSFNVKIGQFM